MSAVGWGIVGCGWAAGDMSRAIAALDGSRVVAVFDRDDERARDVAKRYGATAHASLEALLADDVAVVYVALPHHLLAPTAEQALRAGKHVLVEKPLALDAAAIASLGRLAEEQGRVLAPVFELRAKRVFREARRLVAGGAIGRIDQVRIRTVIDKPSAYWAASPWRATHAEAGGGVVLMNTIHQLDLVLFMTGLEVSSVSAEVDTRTAEVEVEDSAAAALRFTNGAIGSLVAAAHSPGAVEEEWIELDGSHGRIDLPHPSGAAADRLCIFLRRPWEGVDAGRRVRVDAGEADAYVDYVSEFVAAVRGEGEPPASADDAAAAVATLNALYASAAEGRRVSVER